MALSLSLNIKHGQDRLGQPVGPRHHSRRSAVESPYKSTRQTICRKGPPQKMDRAIRINCNVSKALSCNVTSSPFTTA